MPKVGPETERNKRINNAYTFTVEDYNCSVLLAVALMSYYVS